MTDTERIEMLKQENKQLKRENEQLKIYTDFLSCQNKISMDYILKDMERNCENDTFPTNATK